MLGEGNAFLDLRSRSFVKNEKMAKSPRGANAFSGKPKRASKHLTEEYSAEESEFIQAVDRYKQRTNRQFPTCRELLTILHELGYTKLSES